MKYRTFSALCATGSLCLPLSAAAEQPAAPPPIEVASLEPRGDPLLSEELEESSGADFAIGAAVDITSRCVARGVPCSTGGSVLPSFEVGAWGVTASATAYLGFDPNAPQVLEELDVGVAWGTEIGDLGLEAGVTGITFPSQEDVKDQMEIVASLSYAVGPVTFGTEQAVEVAAEPGAYYGEVNATAELELHGTVTASATASFGWGNRLYNEALFEVSEALPQAVGGELSVDWDVGAGMALHPHAGAWYSTDSRVREALEAVVVWNAGVSVSGSW